MAFTVSIDRVQRDFPQFKIISALTPSEWKAAFHVKDQQGDDLCLKIINPNSEVSRVKREIVALQSLSHPNLAKLVEYTYSSRQGQETHYMVEEFVDGDDLSARLGTPWSLDETIHFFGLLYQGLSELARLELVHRDLKPSNIRVRPDGIPVIIDFGLVRHLKLSDITQTVDGAAIGTPRYFAPEQCRGNKYDIDHRTDLFATGVLLYEALTGDHPFYRQGMSQMDLFNSICDSEDWKGNINWIKLPDNWKLLTERLLAKERSDRPFDARQVLRIHEKLEGE